MLCGYSMIASTRVMGAERENRHVRMPGYDPFGERLGKVFDGISAGERAEGRGFLVRAVAFLADRMAARAVLLDQHFALVDEGLVSGVRGAAGLRSTTLPKSPALSALCTPSTNWHDGTGRLLSS
jgi:hypothetical protein